MDPRRRDRRDLPAVVRGQQRRRDRRPGASTPPSSTTTGRERCPSGRGSRRSSTPRAGGSTRAFLDGWQAAREVDPDPARPTVAAQQDDPASTPALVRRLVALRRATPALGTRAATRVLHEGYPLTYLTGDRHLVVVNPRREPSSVTAPELAGVLPLLADGGAVSGDRATVEGFGYGVFELVGRSA